MKAGDKKLKNSGKLTGWLLLPLLGLIWGSSYILIKKGLVAFDAGQLGALRIAITALIFVPIFIHRYREIDWSKLKYFAVVGFIGSLIPALLFAYAQTKISSSLTGVLSSLTPIFTLVLGIFFFRIKATGFKIFGVIIGLAGTCFLFLFGQQSGANNDIYYGLLVVFACLLYSTSLNTVNAYLKSVDPVITSAVAFVLVGIPSLLYLGFSDFFQVMQNHPAAWSSLAYISILAFFGTFIGSILFFRLVVLTNALFASLVSYLIPIVAIGWGFTDGELIAWYHIVGMILILIGVYTTNK